MAKAAPRHNSNELQTNETGTDEVEKSLELLDKVLLEFEEQENTPAGEPESPSQGHQSEDDGYMSMNGRRAKFVPDFLPTEEVAPAHSTLPSTLSNNDDDGSGAKSDEKFSPPTPEEAERIISNLLPHISPSTTQGDLNNSAMPCIEFKFSNNNDSIHTSNLSFGTKYSSTVESEASSTLNSLVSTNAPLQTTLPKTRPATVFPSRYASLPSSNPKPSVGENDQQQQPSGNGVYIGRDFIGIKINDVHNAVLKSGARMPETIVNPREHPVTIYPGPLPQKRVPPRTLPGSIERHREVCRKNPNSSDLSSSSTSSTASSDKDITSPLKELKSPDNFNDFIKRPKSPTNEIPSPNGNSPTSVATQLGVKISIQTMDNLMNSRNIMKMEQKMNLKNRKRNSQLSDNEEDDEDKFSDDSLEDTSLPPPAPPPIVVPPPPSLSAPVTPSKRHSIAWEVNLDDLCSNGNGTKVIGRRQNSKMAGDGSESQSQSSICSTPGQSSASNKISSDWPDPPDIPICSTEDEAGSLYSDSDDVIPDGVDIDDGKATYVIRKGRRRQRIVDEFGSASMSSINSKLSNEGLCNDSDVALNVPSPIFPPSMMVPNSRHSIDLGASPRKHALHQHHNNNYHHHVAVTPNIVSNSPRSRLSLDLSSPNTNNTVIDLQSKLVSTPTSVSTPTASKSPSVTKITTPTSPMVANSAPFPSRYTEFKTYSSTFDGLQALESHASGTNGINANRASTTQVNTSPDNNPLMRVSSLPVIPPQNQLTGDSTSTPRRELAPPIEEDEEDSDGTRAAPLRQIENNISALLRGDIAVAQVPTARPSRPLGFRSGVHKSESAKEMLLSQQYFGPLPATPPSSPEADSDEFPPLPHTPPSPNETLITHGIQNISISRKGYRKEHRAPAVPPHAPVHSYELKTRSMDAGFSKAYHRNGSLPMPSPRSPGQTLPHDLPSTNSSRRRLASSGYPKRSAQSPREERRLQTSCSLPETPIFTRGCDIPRGTPHRRAAPDPPGSCGSSRTNPHHNSLNSSSIVGIGCTTISSTGGRSTHRSINHALQANGELMRIGLPARGWRQTRTTASTEHLDRLHQGSMRAWEMTNSSGKRKPTTLPPNMTPPKFFNKSPRDALRRVTSLLINRKGNSTPKEKEKENTKREKPPKERDSEMFMQAPNVHRSPRSLGDIETPPQPKKKGFFKSFWKKSRHYSLEQN